MKLNKMEVAIQGNMEVVMNDIIQSLKQKAEGDYNFGQKKTIVDEGLMFLYVIDKSKFYFLKDQIFTLQLTITKKGDDWKFDNKIPIICTCKKDSEYIISLVLKSKRNMLRKCLGIRGITITLNNEKV